MKNIFLIFFLLLSFIQFTLAKDTEFTPNDLFHIDQMNSHNNNFALYFKSRERSVLARGEESNYINDYPKDLYI